MNDFDWSSLHAKAALDPSTYLDPHVIREAGLVRFESPEEYPGILDRVKACAGVDSNVWQSGVSGVYKALVEGAKRAAKETKEAERQKRLDKQADEKRAKRAAFEARMGAYDLEDVPVFRLGSSVEIARLVMGKFEEERPIRWGFNELYQYDPSCGVWRVVTQGEARSWIQFYDGAPIISDAEDGKERTLTIQNTAAAFGELVVMAQASTPKSFWDSGYSGVAFRNVSVLYSHRTRSITFAELDEKHRLRFSIDIDLDQDAEAPVWLEYMSTVFDNDGAAKAKLLQEFMGAAILGNATSFGRAIVIYDDAEGGTGKSTFLDVFGEVVGQEFRCSLAPNKLNSFKEGAALIGKRLNMVSELPKTSIHSEAGFKAIVHGDMITVRQNYARNATTYKPEAAHIFAGNGLPDVPGSTDAFWDRWLVVHFDRRFRETKGERKNIKELVRQDEMSGVIMWAVRGVRRLVERGSYTIPESTKSALTEWKRETRPLGEWLENETSASPVIATTRQVWLSVTEWSRKNGHTEISNWSQSKVTRELKKLGAIYKRDTNSRGFLLDLSPDTPF